MSKAIEARLTKAQTNVERVISGQPVFFKGDDLNKFFDARVAYVARLNDAQTKRDAIASKIRS